MALQARLVLAPVDPARAAAQVPQLRERAGQQRAARAARRETACNKQNLTCANPPEPCGFTGASCTLPTDCCGMSCVGGRCGPATCTSDHQVCRTDAECCSGTCGSTCTPLNLGCHTSGNACSSSQECCSHLCKDGKCLLRASCCIQTGDACARAQDCCAGTCLIKPGKTLGVCQLSTMGEMLPCPGYVDGSVCNGCGECCSGVCAPGRFGVDVCQPPSGCHLLDDSCLKDSDCCGAPGSGVPGDGTVHCVIQPGEKLGVCGTPTRCVPEGDTCSSPGNQCSSVNLRIPCCTAAGGSGVCQPDALDVPRCMGLGAACRNPGERCASSADCCKGSPCVPNATGALTCLPFAPDGGVACVPELGNCTIDGDCCNGLKCARAIGSMSGQCKVGGC